MREQKNFNPFGILVRKGKRIEDAGCKIYPVSCRIEKKKKTKKRKEKASQICCIFGSCAHVPRAGCSCAGGYNRFRGCKSSFIPSDLVQLSSGGWQMKHATVGRSVASAEQQISKYTRKIKNY